ncbi:MAG TPA: hypothetical protein VFB15_04405 [Candidatus Binataceae bacterium]|jgi:hypothetical protein|nr:hypothetical protein [Candidatus Binataceae bacterium]
MRELMSEKQAVASALIAVARVRYAAFRERFGREPEPDEPLLFDPTEDQPTAASAPDRTLQIISAALLSNVDAKLVLDYLGSAYQH